MDAELPRAVEELITRQTDRPARIKAARSAGGGCINEARTLELDDGRLFFMKSNPAPLPGMFEREAEGLEALAAVGAIRVPKPIGTGGEPGGRVMPFIVTEAIEVGSRGPQFFETFGRQLAALHQRSAERGTPGGRFGFEADNYIGATPQPNEWTADWCEFWRERRLGYQLRMARRRGASGATLDRLGEQLLDRLDGYLADPDEPPCLLHGDLWGGNYLVDQAGAAVLIDPAAYYGRREADLAMTMLFGGFSERFYSAYEEVWPLADGARQRLEIYKLYHVLNHLNLFGSSYREQCVSILRSLL